MHLFSSVTALPRVCLRTKGAGPRVNLSQRVCRQKSAARHSHRARMCTFLLMCRQLAHKRVVQGGGVAIIKVKRTKDDTSRASILAALEKVCLHEKEGGREGAMERGSVRARAGERACASAGACADSCTSVLRCCMRRWRRSGKDVAAPPALALPPRGASESRRVRSVDAASSALTTLACAGNQGQLQRHYPQCQVPPRPLCCRRRWSMQRPRSTGPSRMHNTPSPLTRMGVRAARRSS